MKRRLLCFCLTICAALLLVSAAFATNGEQASEGTAEIRITEQRFTDDTRSFQVNLSGSEVRGTVFVAVYAQSAQMKHVEEHTAAETVSVILRNISDTDSVKAMWLDEHYMPLARSDVFKTLEVDAKNHDEFASAVLNMMRDYDADAMAQSSDEYAFGRLIVRSDDALPDLSAYRVVRRISDTEGHTVLQFSNPNDARDCAKYLESRLSTDGYVTPDTLENAISDSGGNNADSSHLSWGVPVIRADSYAANLLQKGVNRQIKVAVVDTGVDYTHPFLRDRTVSGYDFVDGDNDPMDEHYHGTHVAGTVVDCTPGLTNLKIMPVRVLGASGSGTSLNVGLGIQYAADHGAAVINLSLGGTHNSYKEDAINYAMSKNVVVVVAAGNSDANAESHCPAHIKKCITVAAVDENLKPANFSNYGDAVDLAAPGVNIKSCVPNGGYRELNGTSMASPHVAACAAMLLEESASLTPAQVEKKLVETVQIPSGWDKRYGAGVVNMEPSAPVGFYALLYTDGEMAFQRNATPASGKTLRHDPYPISSVAGGTGEYAAWYDQRDYIERVTFAEEVRPVSTALWFYGCKNLKSVQNVKNLDTKNVTDMSQMFARCGNLKTLDLRNLDTGNVTNMKQMFFQCGALTSIYASDKFRVDKVTESIDMFTGCASLVGGSGTKYSDSYTGKTYARIDAPPSRPGYFTDEEAKVFYAILYTDGEMVFQNSAMPASGRETLSAPFQINAAVEPAYAGWYSLRSKITTVTFAEEVHPVSTALWFYGCENLKTVRNPENLKTGEVKDMSQMFSRCGGLETLDLRGVDTGNVTNMKQMFFQCGSLKTILVSDAFSVAKVQDSADMFKDCSALTGGRGTMYNAKYIDKAYARIDGGSSNPGYFSDQTHSEPNPNPSHTLYAVLYSNGELKFQSSPDTEPGRTAVKSYTTDSGGYDGDVYVAWYEERMQISSVNFGAEVYPTSTALWFYDCKNLSSVKNPGNLHTDYVTDMSQMFAYCSGVASLDLSRFNTAKVEDTSMMFYRCEKLTTIYASGLFATETISDSSLMFGECVALKGGSGTSYSSEHTDKAYARIDSASAAGYFTAK